MVDKNNKAKRLKVAILAPLEETVPPTSYGGTELVVHHLAEGLIRKGHEVTLFSVGGSRTSAKLFEAFDRPLRLYERVSQNNKLREAYKYVGFGRMIEEIYREGGYDIVHNHASWRILPNAYLVNAPLLTTHHGPFGPQYYHNEIYGMYPQHPFTSISNSQRKGAPKINFIATVYNGIDVDAFDFESNPQDYYAFLARFSPEKGPLQAIQIAKKLGKKLIMAAKIDPVDQEFYERELKPHIDGKQIVYMGEADHPQKVELLKNAQALLAPIQWDEPFGLYFIEAMACGTPVLTINRGSAPEIIRHEQTGFLGKDEEELARFASQVAQLNRRSIRRHVEENFSITQLVEGYENTYYKAIEQFGSK